MGHGAGDGDIRNDCNFCVDRCGKIVATGIKSDDRCRYAGDERLGRYDASILRQSGLLIKVRGGFFRQGFVRTSILHFYDHRCYVILYFCTVYKFIHGIKNCINNLGCT
jgi:hypothetical protein